MHEISFRSQPAAQIIQSMIGKRLEGAMAALTETTLVSLFKIATRKGYALQKSPDFQIYRVEDGKFDARFCCEPELHERGSAEA